ncbi:MAG: hypothetical protein K2X87_30865 [Gemmataceae bacterium]|nr:hypothetical protein [Gemmataceae bacterium]
MARKKNGGGTDNSTPPAPEPNGSGGTRKPPAHEVRLGRIRATVWENVSENGEAWFSVTVSRSYKQGDEWRTANSYGRYDLLVVSECCRLAFLWVVSQTVAVRTPLPQTKPPDEEVPM